LAIPYSRYLIGNLPWYSVLMVAGIIVAYLLGTREEKRLALPKDSMLDMVLVAVPCGIVGARLYFVLMRLDQFAADPVSVLYIWEGGVAIYGAVIGGLIGVSVYCHIKKRGFAALLDITAPGLVLAQAIGRWGNYFNREAFGPVITNPAWQWFPAGVLITKSGAEVWHVATFFYESMWNISVFAVLWAIRKRVQRRGDVFLWYMVLYGCGRFLVEQLRTDSLYLFGIRASQYLSLLLAVLVAAVFVIRFHHEHKGIAFGAALLACALAFARPLLAGSTYGIAITLGLYAAFGVCLFLWQGAPRPARVWLLTDAAVYIALLAAGYSQWWLSPYFLYTALSIPLYLAIPYARLTNTQARPAEV
jgi:phosphatidylglycerol---prolipoprotein diacylglyceryl transferase